MLVSKVLRGVAFVAIVAAPLAVHAQSSSTIPPGPGVVPGTVDPVPRDAHVDDSTVTEAEKALAAAGYTHLQMLQKGYDSVWSFKADNSQGHEVYVGWSRARGVFSMQT